LPQKIRLFVRVIVSGLLVLPTATIAQTMFAAGRPPRPPA
jgi:hypothetical protein